MRHSIRPAEAAPRDAAQAARRAVLRVVAGGSCGQRAGGCHGPGQRMSAAACTSTLLVVGLWYASNLLFNVGMKRCFAVLPDAMVLTTMQLFMGTVVLAPVAFIADGAEAMRVLARRRGRILLSACFFLGGTLSTNVSLTLLSISFTQIIKSTEPIFTVVLCYCVLGERPSWLVATTRMADFRASWVGRGPDADGSLALTDAEAHRLGVTAGDFLRVLES